MYVAFLGTGNALPSVDRANSALALVSSPGAKATLVDCGGDPFRSLRRLGLGANHIDDLIITHAHIDHIAGLPSLIESFRIADRTAPLRIFTHAHAAKVVRDLLQTFAFELTLDHWPFPVEIQEFTPGKAVTIGNFLVTPIETVHTVPSVGLRFVSATEPTGSVVAYTSDTQMAEMLPDIARDATLFIAEATYPRGHEEAARNVRHMTAQQAAEVARLGNAGALALVHLSVNHATEHTVRREARQVFHRSVYIPRDGRIYQVERTVRTVSRLP